MTRQILLFAVVFCFGILSMGYQQLGSRVLAPYFGSDYIVWAVLISTFLGAFTAGSFLGGWISDLPRGRRRAAFLLVGAAAVAALFTGSLVRRPLLAALDQSFESVLAALLVACLALFTIPIVTMSSVTPVAIEMLVRTGVHPGKAAGRLYGVSTLGNIAGVFLTALFLIPNFAMPGILHGWTLTAAVCFTAFWLLLTKLWDARD
ncbi:MAG: fused MFS/spermidine synthase [Chthoniobacterales bacterium]